MFVYYLTLKPKHICKAMRYNLQESSGPAPMKYWLLSYAPLCSA